MQNTLTKPRIRSANSFTAYRDLLMAWTMRIVRARYQQSVLGGLWAIIQPLATVIIFTIIFTQIIPISTPGDRSYAVFSFAAMVPWTFFANSISDMVGSMVDNMNLVTKIYFPREILPIASLLARFVDFLIAGIMLVILMIYYRVPFFPLGYLFLPLIIAIQIALSLGLGFIGGAVNVFYRDVKHVVALGLQLWFYATPIVYPAERIPLKYLPLYYLNPMAGIITSYRQVLLYHQLPGYALLISGIIAIIVLLFGYWFFKRVEFQFADVV